LEAALALINIKKKEVQAKIVYYGPGRGGKTTNLEYIFNKFKESIKSEMITIKTNGDRTLFFDFLPLNAGKIRDYSVKIQLYTVPGQVIYNETRRLVLRGADGIVFVADSMSLRKEKNLISLKNLQENLSTYKKSIFNIPLVIQYNKRDLETEGIPLIPIEVLDQSLNNKLKVPAFEASALSGENVMQTLRKIISLTVSSLAKEIA
jgi:mutual gliding-motility protein MglA